MGECTSCGVIADATAGALSGLKLLRTGSLRLLYLFDTSKDVPFSYND